MLRRLGSALGLVSMLLGCSPFVQLSKVPGSCAAEDITYLWGWRLDGHAPLSKYDYPRMLCGDDEQPLDAGERRRMVRDTSHYRVAEAWARHGEVELALATYRRDLAGATEPDARVADHIEIAKLLSASGDHDGALRELDATHVDTDGVEWPRVEDTRVDVLAAAGRHAEAIALLEARPVSNWQTNEAFKQLRLGKLLLAAHELERARVAYGEAIELFGQHGAYEAWDARLGIARVMQQQGQARAALTWLEQAIAGEQQRHMSSKLALAWRLRAELLLELDEPWSAAASVRRAFELEHTYREPTELARAKHHSELARLHARAGRHDLAASGYGAAYQIYQRVLGASHHATAVAANNVGVAYLDSNDPEQAIAWLQLSVELDERADSSAYSRGITLLNLASAETRAGQPANAVRSITAAIELLENRDDPRVQHELSAATRAKMYRMAARAYLDASMCEAAVEHIEAARAWQAPANADAPTSSASDDSEDDEAYLIDLLGTRSRLEQLRRCSID